MKQKEINQAMEMNESTEKEEKGQRTGRIPSLRDWIEKEGSDGKESFCPGVGLLGSMWET